MGDRKEDRKENAKDDTGGEKAIGQDLAGERRAGAARDHGVFEGFGTYAETRRIGGGNLG